MPFPFDVRANDPAPTAGVEGEVRAVNYRGPDRRNRPTPRFSRFTFFGGRRRKPRRAAEAEGTFVDQYSPRLVLLLTWIALMNAADSFFTLVHIQAGGIELNPVAGAMLGFGRFGFVVAKGALITLPLIVLCQHKNFSIARAGLWLASGAYTLLLAYHLSLL
ncbi:MAG: DUF5658 family protein [Planctomycetes bacterium]|nr:DUF5658 family protein [Planctomycetota bacterium]